MVTRQAGGMFVQMRLKGGERKKRWLLKCTKNFGWHEKENLFKEAIFHDKYRGESGGNNLARLL